MTRDQIYERLKYAETDPARLRKSDPGDPDKCPIGKMHMWFSSPETHGNIRASCTGAIIGCADCKMILAGSISGTNH